MTADTRHCRMKMMATLDESKQFAPMPQLPEPYYSQALQAERDLLGLLMLFDGDDLPDIRPDCFSTIDHLTIFYAIEMAFASVGHCDAVTTSEALEGAGALASVGGVRVIAEMACSSPRLRPYQLASLVQGYALMRYRMACHTGRRVVARLDDALANGWLHGRAWRASRQELEDKGLECLFDLMDCEGRWVCYICCLDGA